VLTLEISPEEQFRRLGEINEKGMSGDKRF
jgi:hypothetical protein